MDSSSFCHFILLIGVSTRNTLQPTNSKVTRYSTEEVYQVRSISYINQFTMKSLVVAIIISGIRRMSRGA